jgi:hypothetical protein
MQSPTLRERLETFGWLDEPKCEPRSCLCDHKLIGTGAVFFQSQGILRCNNCDGFQLIRKPLQ